MNPNFDMYYDGPANRSPTSARHNGSLHRQGSRNQFEAPHGYLPSGLSSGLYTAEDHARYEPARFGGDMRNATIGGYGGGYDMGGQSWNAASFNANHSLNGLGGPGLRKPPSRGGRSGLPSSWLDQPQTMHMGQMNPFMGGLGGMNGPMRQDPMINEPDDDLIPTAIVIKNIPFAIKKEQLVEIMTNMGLPLPYAFNYHFDNGVFRGLAFANFTNADETAAVIDGMNHFELNGRKLRVEYKKMLPAAERERIEREKRERRGQLEEQHRPMAPATLQTQISTSSLTSSRLIANSPSPISGRNMGMNNMPQFAASSQETNPSNIGSEIDLNDPATLDYYNKLFLFKNDPTRERFNFPPTLAPPERRIVHTVAHHLGLGHVSKGEANQRAVHVFKEPLRVSPPMPQISSLRFDERRGLNRAATTDFTDVRTNESYYNGPRPQGSGYLGTYHESSGSLGPGSNLRAAKSFADLRSYTPSPVPSSTQSIPSGLRNNNTASFQDLHRDGASSSNPTLMTPTSSLADRGETGIINGLGNMNLGGGLGGSPHRLRGIASWDRETPGPIGGHRSFSTNFDDRSQGRPQDGPARQPRGPLPERGTGFPRSRQNGHVTRNSDELSQQSSAEITVE